MAVAAVLALLVGGLYLLLGLVRAELDEAEIQLHLADVKGPVRDVLQRSNLDARLRERMHQDLAQALAALDGAPRPGNGGSDGFPDHAARSPQVHG